MAKKALCVGINDYPGDPKYDLRGCVNDANAWASLLKDHYQFPEVNVKILLDQQATKAVILSELRALVSGAKSGDVLVYTFAGHGSYVVEKGNGSEANDEYDGYDETQCAHDENIIDDEVRAIIKDVPDGVRLTIISDSCHSGSVSRGSDDEPVQLPDDRRDRFLSPAVRGGTKLTSTALKNLIKKATRLKAGVNETRTRLQMKEVLLSGCSAEQTSMDANFGTKEAPKYHGAMTYFALQIIKDKGYDLTYEDLHGDLGDELEDNNYTQYPQLEGPRAMRNRKLFS